MPDEELASYLCVHSCGIRFADAISKNLHALNVVNKKISDLYSGSVVRGMTKEPFVLQNIK